MVKTSKIHYRIQNIAIVLHNHWWGQ